MTTPIPIRLTGRRYRCDDCGQIHGGTVTPRGVLLTHICRLCLERSRYRTATYRALFDRRRHLARAQEEPR